MKTIRFIGVLLLAIVAAYAQAFANGHAIVPIMAWIAPALLLRVTRWQPPVTGFVIALAVMTPAWLFQWGDVFRLHGLMIYISAATMSAIGLAPYLADRLIARRLPAYLGMLVFPCAMVAMEWCFTLISPFGSWGASAYSQTDFTWLMQSASVTGMWGVSFLLAWFASATNTAFDQRADWKQAAIPATAFAGVLAMVVGAGAWRVSHVQTTTPTHVAIAIPQYANNLNYSLDYSAPIRAFMFAQTEALARNGANLIVWPEDTVAIAATDEADFLNQGRQLAQQRHAAIALSYTLRLTPESLRYENKNVLIEPSGALAWNYRKSFPVPGYEMRNMNPGNGEIATARLPLGMVQGAICFDLDHRTMMRQVGSQTALLLAPSDDWPAIVDLHKRMLQMRAVEYGVPILRPTINGVSAAFDAYGRTLAAGPVNGVPPQIMNVSMSVGGVPTFYPRIGELFAWFCAAALGLLGLFSVLPKRRVIITPQPVAAE